MNRELLVSCETKEQVIGEIIRQNMIINESIGYIDTKGGRDCKNGFYLKINNTRKNTGFDTIVFGCVNGYLESIEAYLDGNINEFINDSIWDAIVMIQEVMLDWVNGRYWNIITPKNVEDLVDIIFDEEKSQNVCNYLYGIIKRLAKNLLFCSSKYENNNFTANPRKISRHICKNGVQSWEYTYFLLSSIDRQNDDCDNIYANYQRPTLLDKHYYNNNMLPTLDDDENSSEGKLEAILQFFKDEKAEKIRKVFYNEELINYRDAVDMNCRNNIKKQEKRDVSFRNIKFEGGYIKYAGDFIDFCWKLMSSQSLIEKFNMIEKALNRNDIVGNTLMDLILDLDFEIYHQFFEHCKDSRFIKYYVKSDNFRKILDVLLDEYKAKQCRFREIYTYNESQRREKINKLRDILLKLKQDNYDSIDIIQINKLYKYYVEEFDLEEYNSKFQLNKIENKIIAMRALGFEMEKVDNRKYLLKDVG